jgi:UPF0755 protein
MRTALGALLLVLGIGLAGAAWVAGGLFEPAASSDEPRLFVVREQETLTSVARRLDAAGLLPDRTFFGPHPLVLYARLRGIDRSIKSGEYELDASMNPTEILQKLVAGSVKTYPVTVPGGLTIEEVAGRVAEAGISDEDEVIARAREAAFARELGVDADSLEGYLYPETYRFRRATPATQVLRQMVEELQASWKDADRQALDGSGFTLHEIVTIASIVEKETGVPEERPRIAAVFRNRLERRMRLQSDPTVIYGILRERGAFNGNLRKRDLQTDTPYNTYTRAGLPPGPISNVTMAAIRAVLQPEEVPYLYFVSQNDGTHHFSVTLTEHVNAVNRYQRRRP